MRLLALLAAGAAFYLAFDEALVTHRSYASEDRSYEERYQTVVLAAGQSVPDAVRLADFIPGTLHGVQARSGRHVAYSMVLSRRFDWAGVSMDDARGGAVVRLLEHASVLEKALSASGFVPIAGRGRSVGRPDRQRHEGGAGDSVAMPGAVAAPRPEGAPPPRPTLHVTVDTKESWGGGSGQGRGGYLMNLGHPLLIHHRLYLHPGSGAALFVRSEFDQDTKILSVELSFADRTILGQDYDLGTFSLAETVDRPAR